MAGLGIDIAGIIGGAGKIIDQFVTTPEERAKAKASLMVIEKDLTAEVLGFEKMLVRSQADVIIAEAQSASWMARNWRPMLMLVITTIIAHKMILFPYLSKWFDIPDLPIPDPLWSLLQLAVGGYIGARSGEKIATTIRGTESAAAMGLGSKRADRKASKAKAKQMRQLIKLAGKNDWSDALLQERLDALDN